MKFRINIPDVNTLCTKCTNSTILNTAAGPKYLCEDYDIGRAYRNGVPPVLQCSAFVPYGSMSKHEMEKKAWVLEVKGKHIIGFKPPQKTEDD